MYFIRHSTDTFIPSPAKSIDMNINEFDNPEEYPFSEETHDIIKCALEVAHYFGPGFLESVYQKALEMELQDCGFTIEPQKLINVYYKGKDIGAQFKADIVVNNTIVLELKAVSRLTKADERQIIHYLKATGCKIGLLLNFGNKSGLEWKRFIWTGKSPQMSGDAS